MYHGSKAEGYGNVIGQSSIPVLKGESPEASATMRSHSLTIGNIDLFISHVEKSPNALFSAI
ncbi:hypothetical protein EMCG_03397 [[Emmonsia] crescens]|uniref:Uncharacterized protein n=1 Tax=[Emmonsia] crescens TaxID=73230 RepID=A0A0G2HVL2_9EURO|nr:hypothetical protein EMCG_03397 [Emmonsia crescens UAMH 3008]